MVSQSLSISSTLLPACKHTRTLEVPSGTVGGTIGRTTRPASWQRRAKFRGCGVQMEKMGDFGGSLGGSIIAVAGRLVRHEWKYCTSLHKWS